jgi:peptidoglycan hydrolase-like protein with peptidoglycan-binding domain
MPSLPARLAPPKGRRRTAIYAFAALVGLAVIGWAAARQIRSPAQVAADTAAPKPAAITVPVARRVLSTEVIVRGTVRYGDPQAAVLGTSSLKQGASSDIVTRPPRLRARLGRGDVAMTVDGRPVFVLPGAIPMHRDLRPGDHGPDVRQLERALAGMGFHPGRIDGRYDSATAAAVSAFYLKHGWDPFGATEAQVDALRTAQAAAAAARDAHLQSVNTLEQARRGQPADAAQARLDAVTARDAYDTATLGLSTAKTKYASARDGARVAAGGEKRAKADADRDRIAANADVAAKRAAFKAALDAQEIARYKFGELERTAPESEQVAASQALRETADDVARTKAELDASVAARTSLKTSAPSALRKARSDDAQARRDLSDARAELRHARQAVDTSRRAARLAGEKARALSAGAGDTSTLAALARSDAREARRTQAVVARLSRQAGVQVPADEMLFFPSLPLRVDSVRAKRGSAVQGPVMRVTNSRLAIDSSLDVSDAKLVKLGDPVVIEEQELNVKGAGQVTQLSDTPGTNRVDPSRFYFAATPAAGFPSIVGTSVKLTIAVKSTKGAVLAVPPSALSIGGNGNSRLQVRRNGRTVLVSVVPGLAAEGLVEIRPAPGQQLRPGDLVIVGERGGRVP